MSSGLQSEIDKALGLSPSQPLAPPAKQAKPAGVMAAARQQAALEAEIQSLQARLLALEDLAIKLNKASSSHGDWIKALDKRTKKLTADVRPWWKKLFS